MRVTGTRSSFFGGWQHYGHHLIGRMRCRHDCRCFARYNVRRRQRGYILNDSRFDSRHVVGYFCGFGIGGCGCVGENSLFQPRNRGGQLVGAVVHPVDHILNQIQQVVEQITGGRREFQPTFQCRAEYIFHVM